MATSDKNKPNRFLYSARVDQAKPDTNKMLLNILKDEFPDDMYFSRDRLTPPTAAEAAFEANMDKETLRKRKKIQTAERNEKNVLDVNVLRDEYEGYEISKSIPTIDEDELDDLIDEEWTFFEDADEDDEEVVAVVEPAPTGLFLVNSETDLTDFHDLYINGGPQNIDPEAENITDRIFCVFFIRNGIAYPIPTYKTLEVMLVERGLTYDNITEATPEQVKDFDLLLDGDNTAVSYDTTDPEEQDDDDDITPYEEFIQRSMPDRDGEWNYGIRFRSGYRPKAPFLRDPGDYIKPESMRAIDGRQPVDEDGEQLPSDLYIDEDPGDRYFDQVFQKQTGRERLREKFEGKMAIADWPSPEYDSDKVNNADENDADDAVFNLRLMINGHWKQVTDGRVMKLYAYLNEYDISNYAPVNAGRYGPTGYIQMLIDAGGVQVIQPNNGSDEQNDVLTGDSDLARRVEPLWNAFPHIVEADRLDFAEYQDYLDNYSNGGNPFMVPELLPYEPPGSIKYYNKAQYADLIQQALEQEQIDAIKDQIFDIWPEVAAIITNMKVRLDAVPLDFSGYVDQRLGRKGPLYKIWLSKQGKWKYVKKLAKWRGGRIKRKESHQNLFKVMRKSYRAIANLNEREENKIVNKYKWMKSVARDKFAGWLNKGGRTAVAGGSAASTAFAFATGVNSALNGAAIGFRVAGYGSRMAGALTGVLGNSSGVLLANPIFFYAGLGMAAFALADKLIGEVPADKYILPPWRFMDDNWYLKACIYNELDDTVESYSGTARSLDIVMPALKADVDEVYEDMGSIDDRLQRADTAEEFQELLDQILALRTAFEQLDTGGLLSEAFGLKSAVDEYLVDQLKRQYNAIQFMRKKIHRKVGNKKKFGIVWPKGPQQILNTYVPGCKFDNYVPKK